MAESLLASLHNKFSCAPEDIATLSLQYILSQYSKLNVAFNTWLFDLLEVNVKNDIKYSCQESGEENERPDMSGYDDEGNEIVVYEMKFYASLTINQPVGYLDRLKRNGGKALIFICLENRKSSLWRSIKKLCEEDGRALTYLDEHRVITDGITMSVISWEQIIRELKRIASVKAIEAESDIDQLAGYCEMMNNTAFIPFVPEDLEPMVAIKEDRYYSVIDELYNAISQSERFTPPEKQPKGSPARDGYTRNLIIDGYYILLIYDRNTWRENSAINSPFWVYIAEENKVQSKEFKSKFSRFPEAIKYATKYTNEKRPSRLYDSKLGSFILLALTPQLNVSLNEVIDNMMNQIYSYVDILKKD